MIPTVDQAVALHQAGRLAEAEQCYRTILGVEPKTIGAVRGLGTVLLQTDRAAEAAEPLQTALDIEPDNADTLNNLGSAQLQLGQLDNARKTYEQAVALPPSFGRQSSRRGGAPQLGANSPAVGALQGRLGGLRVALAYTGLSGG